MGFDLPFTDDYLDSRTPLMANNDLVLGLAAPKGGGGGGAVGGQAAGGPNEGKLHQALQPGEVLQGQQAPQHHRLRRGVHALLKQRAHGHLFGLQRRGA